MNFVYSCAFHRKCTFCLCDFNKNVWMVKPDRPKREKPPLPAGYPSHRGCSRGQSPPRMGSQRSICKMERTCRMPGKSYYLDHFFYCFGKLFPVSSGILWRRIRMEILSSASSSEKIWTKRRRNPFGLCVGCMASANRLLLLHYAGYGADGSGKPVCYLYFTGDFYGIYLYENPEYLGSDNYSFSE